MALKKIVIPVKNIFKVEELYHVHHSGPSKGPGPKQNTSFPLSTALDPSSIKEGKWPPK